MQGRAHCAEVNVCQSHRPFFIVQVLLALLAFGATASAHADSDATALASSSLRIFCRTDEGIMSGSGVVVGNDGRFALTNSHVVTGCHSILVLSPRDSGEPKKTEATVVWDSKTSLGHRSLDAALLALADSVDRPGVRFASKGTVEIRDAVIAIVSVRRPRFAAARNADASPPRPSPPQRAPARNGYVLGVAGPYSGNRLPLASDLVFGRDPRSCNVVFAADQDCISSRHCSLRFDPARGAFELRDLGSVNGTFARGKRIAPSKTQQLQDGDEFYLCERKYRFVVRTGSDEGVSAVSPQAS
jgi:hypothetical protein